MKRLFWLAVTAVIAVAVVVAVRWRGACIIATKQGAKTIPAAHVAESEALPLLVQETAGNARGRSLVLSGRHQTAARIRLDLVPARDPHLEWGRCDISAEDPSAASAFLALVARFLTAEASPESTGPSPRCQYVRIGEDAGWEVIKLAFLVRGGQQAAIFLRLRPDSDTGELVEKDPGQRSELVQLLAAILAPRVSHGTLPAPLATLRPLEGAQDDLRPGAFAGKRYLAPRQGKRGGEVWIWSDPARPPKLLFSARDVVIDAVWGGSIGKYAGLTIIPPSKPDEIRANDPAEIHLVDLSTGESKLLAGSTKTEWLALGSLLFSPDESQVAVGFNAPGSGLGIGRVRVLDVATVQALTETDGSKSLRAFSWDRDGIRLAEASSDSPEPPEYLWDPRSGGAPQPHVSNVEGKLKTPDGRFALRLAKQGLVVEGPQGPRRFQPDTEDRVTALRRFAENPEWFGRHRAGLYIDSNWWVLDLESFDLRPLLGDSLGNLAVRPGFDVLIGRSDTDGWVWANLPH